MSDQMPWGGQEKKGWNGRNNSSFNWTSLLWMAVLLFLFISLLRGFGPPVSQNELSYTEFKQAVQKGRVEQITIKGNEISGVFKSGQAETDVAGHQEQQSSADQADNRFHTVKPDIEDTRLLSLLEDNNVIIDAESTEDSWWGLMLISLLPWFLIIGLIYYSSRKMQQGMGGAGGGGLFSFAKSKAKRFNKETVTVSYEDVAGLNNAKKELQEIVAYLKNPAHFKTLGATLPKGILLIGPPGVGKTLMAKATAGEANVPFFSISGSEFIEMFVGVGASRVRDMFKQAKQNQPSIIFIDELDSIGRVRGTGVGGGHDEREQTLNQILAEMDGFSPRESVIVLAATNRPDVLDPALVRPGRFDRQITLELPQKKARQAILKTHARKVAMAQDVDLENFAERTPGLSGAELRNIINEAALLAARERKEQVEMEDLEQARDKILMGIEREDVINEKDKKVVAFHEAGHALTAKLQPGTDPLQKVTIIPRGRSLGATEQVPEEDRYNLKKSYLLSRIAVMLGGRVSEQLVFGEVSTGAGNDLKRTTQIARRMICEWGMSENLGPITFPRTEPHPFLGRELTEPKDYSEHTARLIDEEVQSILVKKEKDVLAMLQENQDKLEKLADALLEHETLSDAEVDEILGMPAGRDSN